MARETYRTPTGVPWCQRAAPLLLGALLLMFPTDGRCGRAVGSGGRPGGHDPVNQAWHSGSGDWRGGTVRISDGKGRQRSVPERVEQNGNLSPEDKARLSNKYRQWESLTPAKQEDLRRRMERWKELAPGDRELLRKRYQQWQQISPEERQGIKDKLNRWNELPPDEQERVRQRFRRP